MKKLITRWWQNRKQDPWQSFAYLSETPGEKMMHQDGSETIASERDLSTISLAKTKVGDRITIVSLNCGEANNRLMGMGLMPGVQIQVVSVTGSGSAIVALDDNRLGLEAKMAQQIQVQNADSAIETKANSTNTQEKAMNKTTARDELKLREASIGARLKVISYEPGSRDYKRKLLAMGLTPGTEFTVKRHAPMGDPTEIEVRGFRLSLRKGEADALIVRPV